MKFFDAFVGGMQQVLRQRATEARKGTGTTYQPGTLAEQSRQLNLSWAHLLDGLADSARPLAAGFFVIEGGLLAVILIRFLWLS